MAKLAQMNALCRVGRRLVLTLVASVRFARPHKNTNNSPWHCRDEGKAQNEGEK